MNRFWIQSGITDKFKHWFFQKMVMLEKSLEHGTGKKNQEIGLSAQTG